MRVVILLFYTILKQFCLNQYQIEMQAYHVKANDIKTTIVHHVFYPYSHKMRPLLYVDIRMIKA